MLGQASLGIIASTPTVLWNAFLLCLFSSRAPAGPPSAAANHYILPLSGLFHSTSTLFGCAQLSFQLPLIQRDHPPAPVYKIGTFRELPAMPSPCICSEAVLLAQ